MTDKPTVYEALSRVMAAVQAVKKGDRNNEQNYNFRGIDAVVNAVGPALREHGVLVTPELLEVGYRDVLTSRGKPSRECTVKVRYRFHGPAGDHLDVVVPGESMDFGDKGAAKAMSVAFRIALLQALAIPTDEPEHDPDAASYERAERSEPQTRWPSPRAVVLFKEATDAGTAEELRGVWERTNAAGKAGDITGDEVKQIRAHITSRGEELAKQAPPEEPPDAQPAPAEDRTAEPAEQADLGGDWPEPARPGNPT